jgi:uncharacterized protein (DUF3820 family)
MPLSDTDRMPFGKYKNEKMANVPAKYLLWLYEQGCDNIDVAIYIAENMDALKEEAEHS